MTGRFFVARGANRMIRAILSVAAYLLTCSVAFAADGPDALNSVPSWLVGAGGTAAGSGIALWYLWYMTSRRLPEIEKQHAEEREKLEERHAAHINLVTTNARADLNSMWAQKRDDDAAIRAEFSRLNAVLEKLADRVSGVQCKYSEAAHAVR